MSSPSWGGHISPFKVSLCKTQFRFEVASFCFSNFQAKKRLIKGAHHLPNKAHWNFE
jgi:hypothetical protein